MPKATYYNAVVEYYQFDFNNLLADFGSYLGLFLGWSAFSLLDSLILTVQYLLNILKKTKITSQSGHMQNSH